MAFASTLPHSTLYTQVVYATMRGMKTAVTTSMMNRVMWLDEESHTVRLARGSIDEGKMNGNMAAPTPRMMPAMLAALASKAGTSRRARRKANASRGPSKPKAGAIQVHGWAAKLRNQAPTCTSAVFSIGFDGPSTTTVLLMR